MQQKRKRAKSKKDVIRKTIPITNFVVTPGGNQNESQQNEEVDLVDNQAIRSPSFTEETTASNEKCCHTLMRIRIPWKWMKVPTLVI